MPGFDFATNMQGGVGTPLRLAYYVGNNLSGPVTANNVAGAVYQGDLVVATTAAAYTSNNLGAQAPPFVIRPLLPADLPSLSQGFLGIAAEGFQTDANGRFTQPPLPSNLLPTPLEVPALSSVFQRPDTTNRHKAPVVLSWGANALWARISPAFSGVQGAGLEGQAAGLDLIIGVGAPLSAPTLSTATTGGTIAAGTYYVVTTYVNQVGETLPSPSSSQTTTGSTSTLTVNSPISVVGATGYNIYVGTSPTGPFYRQNATPVSLGTNTTLTSITTPGVVPPTTNTTGPVGVINYYVNPNTTPSLFRIVQSRDTANPQYGTTAPGTAGVRVMVTVNAAYQQLNSQSNSTTPYTT